MPHNRRVPDDRHVLPLRLPVAAAAMAVVMLLTVALGEWVVTPFASLRDVDEGGVARASGPAGDRPGLQDAVVVWAALSGPWVVHPLVTGTALLLVARRRVPAQALLVVPVSLFGWCLGVLAKRLVERPRPTEALVDVGGWSYPSGHATNVALGAVLLVALLGAVRTVWLRWAARALVLVGVALTAVDRLLLGVHYPTDVLAGLVMGAGMAVVGLVVLRPLGAPRPSSST